MQNDRTGRDIAASGEGDMRGRDRRCARLFALSLLLMFALCRFAAAAPVVLSPPTSPIEPLTVRGENFVNARGQTVRFWGVNLVALYPTRPVAERLAQNLAEMQVNLVRPHHMMRPSTDWNWDMVSGALATYKDNSRTPDPVAWERFDGLNAALRKRGIYLSLAVNWTRSYLPGDVDILTTTPEDRAAWEAALKEFNAWDWQRKIDVQKMLPVVDERSALLEEEFLRRLLLHKNPNTGLTYAQDPQVLTLELINEASTEYAIVNGNRFPEYWHRKLVEKWQTFARSRNVDPGDLYAPKSDDQKRVRAAFFRDLDLSYLRRMKKIVRDTGCKVPVIFSNGWRGDNMLEWQSREGDFVEEHLYTEPRVTEGVAEGFYSTSLTRLAGKPYFLGELNISEGDERIRSLGPYRTMLPLAASAYGSFNNWSGIVWFAWVHGGRSLGQDGRAVNEGRGATIGDLVTDGMFLDHLRTAGMIFRRGLVEPSAKPVTWYVEDPLWAADYHGLMRGARSIKAGWHSIHAFRKAYGPAPQTQASAPWMTQDPGSVLTSDTGQIVRDTTAKQFLVAADQAEVFSGVPGKTAPPRLKHLRLAARNAAFATVAVVSDDGQNLAASRRLVLSRTGLDAGGAEADDPLVRLAGLKPAGGGKGWYVRLARPHAAAALLRDFGGVEWRRLVPKAGTGELVLPGGAWRECELAWR